MFRPLSRESIEGIISIQLNQLAKYLAKQDIKIEVSESCIAFLKDEGFDIQFGARPLKRLIQKSIVDELSLALIKGDIAPGMNVKVDIQDRKVKITSELQ